LAGELSIVGAATYIPVSVINFSPLNFGYVWHAPLHYEEKQSQTALLIRKGSDFIIAASFVDLKS
jgi:hypothetical protein